MLSAQPWPLAGPQLPAAVTGEDGTVPGDLGIPGHFQLDVEFTDQGKPWVPGITPRSPSRGAVLGPAPVQGISLGLTLCHRTTRSLAGSHSRTCVRL